MNVCSELRVALTPVGMTVTNIATHTSTAKAMLNQELFTSGD
jgi:hypothetical protein